MESRYDLRWLLNESGKLVTWRSGGVGHSQQREHTKSRQGNLSTHEVCGYYHGMASNRQVFFFFFLGESISGQTYIPSLRVKQLSHTV